MTGSLVRLSRWFAVAGALVALATGALTSVSVILRALWNHPIPGDVELTQMGVALAISLCLPYCQAQGEHIIVDFFTQKASAATQRGLDRLGCAVLVLFYGLLAWRTSVGAVAVKEAGETTMIMGLPMWWAYASLAPGLALAALLALLQTLGSHAVKPQEAGA
jgi:TRAP-type C4-dicarboxylate transport system permease small subunit